MAERVADATTYARLRAFLEGEELGDRRLTAEWLAGRLSIPLWRCAGALDQLASEGLVHRHTRPGEPPWFDLVSPAPRTALRRLGLGLVVLVICAAVVGTGAMLHHVFYFALGVAIGLMIAFAWLDWELRSRV
jgi:hypothetical protein